MFNNTSNFVHVVDQAFLIILGVSLFFLIFLTGMMIFFIIRYNRKRNPKATQINDSAWLEITWTTIPLIIVLYMFYIGWKGFLPMRQVPKDAMPIKAIGMMWKWQFEYKGDKVCDTLYLPLNKSARIDLISKDVLHGFSIPAFRIKEDVVPQKKNYTWVIPTQIGEYDLFCTVYCGLSHSYMYAVVKVVSEKDFYHILNKMPIKKNNESKIGLLLIEKNGCIACHSIDGSKSVGPTLKGLFGKNRIVNTNGSNRSVKVDEQYIKSSIYDPNADIANGYTQGLMKSYKKIIKDNDVKQITDYLKSISK